MSNQAKPYEELSEFNRDNFPGSSSSASSLDYPVAQGVASLVYGVIWGDGTYQNSASGGGGAALTVQDGTVTVNNVTDINVTNGTLTDNGGGSVSITTGGGGGGVTNPMTADLDAGGFSIFNLPEINDSAAVQYVNMGPVVPGNDYVVAIISTAAIAEGSVTIVSRCLDVGFKQTVVFTATAYRTRGHANVIANLTESDTPIFEAVVLGERSGSLFCNLRCSAPSSTWEVRAYMNQDDKGTIGSYGDSWRLSPSASIAPGLGTVFVEMRLGFQAEGQATMSGDLDVVDGVTCRTLACDTASATTSVTTNTTFTNEIRDNGFAPIGIFNTISMQNNDIQSAGVVGGTAFVGAALNLTIPIGHPTNGPLFVDTQNNRVGINVPVPTEDFEIDGNIQLDSAGANKIKFYDGTATTERAEIDAVASGTGGQLVLYTKEDPGTVTAKMTIQADGRITITNRIEGLPNPVAATDAANKQYVDASIPSLAGYVQNPMTSNLDAASFKITNLLDPTAAQDVATKAYVDSSVPTGFVTNPMSSALDGGNFDMTNINNIVVNNRITSGGYQETFDSMYAGQALSSPLQGFCQFMLPFQSSLGTGVMPTWTNGYLDPQKMSSRVTVTETVTAPGANKLNAVSLISSTIGAYNLLSGAPGSNVIITIPPQLDNHTFTVQVDGEWNGSTIGGNGNSYIYIREDANPAGTIYGMCTGQAVDGARYPCCLNFVGSLPAGDYAILVGHYDLGSSRDYNARMRVGYIGYFTG